MMFLSLAFVFAGVRSYGQLSENGTDPVEDKFLPQNATIFCVPATVLECASAADELNPIPGQPYPYEIGVSGQTAKEIHWFVVDATLGLSIFSNTYDFTAVSGLTQVDPGDGSGDYIAQTETFYNTLTGAGGTDVKHSIEISWKYFDGTSNHILLVAYVVGDECADNIEAWRIKPTPAFTIEIAGLMPDGTNVYGDGNTLANICVSDVHSAEYVPGADGADGVLEMDYGSNYLFFSVNAANWAIEWKPKFIASHTSGSEITEIAWTYPDDASSSDDDNWNIYAATDGVVESTETVKPQQTGSGVPEDGGECIIVRLRVEHKGVENDNSSMVNLMVQGFTGDDLDERDLQSTNCVPYSDTDGKNADYRLDPRPEITEVNPTPAEGPFVPKN